MPSGWLNELIFCHFLPKIPNLQKKLCFFCKICLARVVLYGTLVRKKLLFFNPFSNQQSHQIYRFDFSDGFFCCLFDCGLSLFEF